MLWYRINNTYTMESSQTQPVVLENSVLRLKPLPSISKLFSEAWRFVKKHKNVAFWYSLIVALLGTVTVIDDTLKDTPMEYGTYGLGVGVAKIVLAVLALINTVALLHAVHQTGDSISYKVSLDWGMKNFFPLLWTSIVTGLVILCGLILFVIPGIIALVFFYFTQFAFYHERAIGTKALKASYRVVKGRWWGVFGKILLLLLIFISLSFIINIAYGIIGFLGDAMPVIIFQEFVTQFAFGVVGVMVIYTIARLYENLKPSQNQQVKY